MINNLTDLLYGELVFVVEPLISVMHPLQTCQSEIWRCNVICILNQQLPNITLEMNEMPFNLLM